MSKVTKRKVKQINSKSDVNKVNIFPTLAIILALTVSSIFHYFDNKGILVNYILNKEELSIALGAIKIVSFNFILFNTILLFIELLLFWKKKYKALYVVVGALVALAIWSGTLNFLYTVVMPIIVGIFYIIKSLKKNPNYF